MKRQIFFFAAMTLLAVCVCSNMALGAVVTNAAATGNWVNASTWDNGVPIWVYGNASQQSDAVINGGYTVTINAGDVATAFRVPVGDNTNGETGTLEITGGSLTTDKMLSLGGFLRSATNGTGILNQTGGDIYVGANDPGPNYEQLVIGHKGTSHGEYNISGGTCDAPQGISLGHVTTSSGEMHQTGGTITIGSNPSGGYFNIGNSGVGVYTMTAGSVTMANQPLYLGYAATGDGTVEQSGGSITGINLFVGRLGSADYDMSGGVVDFSENVWVASRGAGQGIFSLSADAMVLIDGNLNVCAAVGDDGNAPSGAMGILNIDGENVTVTVGGDLVATGASVDITNSSLINFTTSTTGGVSTIGVGGSADIDGAVFDIIETSSLPGGTVLDLVETVGGVNNLASASLGPNAAGIWTLQLGGTGGETLQAVKVPEPSSFILLLVGAVMLCVFRRR